MAPNYRVREDHVVLDVGVLNGPTFEKDSLRLSCEQLLSAGWNSDKDLVVVDICFVAELIG